MSTARPSDTRLPDRFTWICRALLIVVALLLAADLRRAIATFRFDDALMFYRYAMQLRHGYGISWNPGGPHTSGLTSPLWLLPVWIGSLTHLRPPAVVVTLSTLFGAAALLVLAKAAQMQAQSKWLSRWEIVFTAIALQLLAADHFRACLTNGMETMFGVLMITLLAIASWRFAKRLDVRSAMVLALVGLGCILVRPESGLIVFTLPSLMWFWKAPRRDARSLLIFFAVMVAEIALLLLANKLYFGNALPLPFYVKTGHVYEGVATIPNPAEYFFDFLDSVMPAIILLVIFVERQAWREYAVYLIPFCLVEAYLFHVTQIMGYDGRYTMPYLPLIYLPAVAAFDRWLASETCPRLNALRFAVVLLLPHVMEHSSIGIAIEKHVLTYGRSAYPQAVLMHAAPDELPVLDWYGSNLDFTDFVRDTPGTPYLALTEAGIVGATVPQDKVLDLAGLNNRDIALRGFSTDYVFGQQPDIIWLPQTDYTGMRGRLLSDPRMLQLYDLYAGVFSYGVAIRKAAPDVAAYRKSLFRVMQRVYPGVNPNDYKVTSVCWNKTLHPLS